MANSEETKSDLIRMPQRLNSEEYVRKQLAKVQLLWEGINKSGTENYIIGLANGTYAKGESSNPTSTLNQGSLSKGEHTLATTLNNLFSGVSSLQEFVNKLKTQSDPNEELIEECDAFIKAYVNEVSTHLMPAFTGNSAGDYKMGISSFVQLYNKTLERSAPFRNIGLTYYN